MTGLAFLALTLAGCTGGAALPAIGPKAQDLPTTVKVIGTDFKFTPATVQLPAGKPVTITFENKGMVEHDLKIPELQLHLVAKRGETVSGVVTAARGGDYAMECTFPGHKDAGMVGHAVFVGDGASQAAVAPPAPQHEGVKALPQGLQRLPQPLMMEPIGQRDSTTVKLEVMAQETTALLDDGVAYDFWTFGGTVPGPMLRVRQGDTVLLTFKNAPDSKITHSIDLHGVTGPGGGAKASQVPPGQQVTLKFKALNPGVYVYHCATPMVAHHIASGMYGLIVVEPPEGLAAVDHEYYVMQGDFYLKGSRGEQGLRDFSLDKMLAEQPDYVLFNGGAGALTKHNAFRAKVGETVRIFFGVGGPNITSSFHVIGEIFDTVYLEGSTDHIHNVQTTLVPTGGAAIAEFKLDVPGSYTLVDHSLGRLEKGAVGVIEVDGPPNPDIFDVIDPIGPIHENPYDPPTADD